MGSLPEGEARAAAIRGHCGKASSGHRRVIGGPSVTTNLKSAAIRPAGEPCGVRCLGGRFARLRQLGWIGVAAPPRVL